MSVQRELPGKISTTVAYVGNLGRHLSTFIDGNYAPYSTVNSSGGALVGALALHRRARSNVANTMPVFTARPAR